VVFDGDGLPFFGGSEATAAVATSFVAASKFGAWGESAARAARVPRDDELESSSARAAGGGGVVAAGNGARRGGSGSGDAGASGEAGSSMMTSVTTSSSLLARRLRRSGVGRSGRSGVGRSGRSGVGRSAETTATGAAGAFSGVGDAAPSKSVMATMSSLQGFDPGVRGLALPGVLGVLARSADFGESPSTLESSSNMARMFALAFSLLFGVIIAAAPEDVPARLSTGCPVAAARKFQATALPDCNNLFKMRAAPSASSASSAFFELWTPMKIT